MKLLREDFIDNKFIVESQDNGEKEYFLRGIHLQSEVQNGNNRVYPKTIMEREIKRYNKEFISKNRAMGELQHPESPSINLQKVSHKITELKMDGNDVYGESKLLDTPYGQIAKRLVDEGIQLGTSSRATGSVVQNEGISVVQEDFRYICNDIVADPSAPDAYLTAVMENKEWIYENGILTCKEIEQIQDDVNKKSKAKKLNEQVLEDIFNKILSGKI